MAALIQVACQNCGSKIADMSLSGSGIRDIARVPEISPDTVMNELKRKENPDANFHGVMRFFRVPGIKRLARKTVCFSELKKMHDIVIGLFIDRYEFGVAI